MTSARSTKPREDSMTSAVERYFKHLTSRDSDSLCGLGGEPVRSEIRIQEGGWDSSVILDGVRKDTLMLQAVDVEGIRETLWNDLCSEYDADNLCRYLDELEIDGQLARSDEFKAFEQAWRRDELNHAVGFGHLYSTLYDVPTSNLFRQLSERTPDFRSIEHFLTDEFRICMVLAYDEIATTRSYKDDHDTFYNKFGNTSLLEWIRLVARDEAFHFNNLVQVIRRNHSHRLCEVPRIIDELLEWDLSKRQYGATFVLDHTGEQFTSPFLNKCREILLKRLS